MSCFNAVERNTQMEFLQLFGRSHLAYSIFLRRDRRFCSCKESKVHKRCGSILQDMHAFHKSTVSTYLDLSNMVLTLDNIKKRGLNASIMLLYATSKNVCFNLFQKLIIVRRRIRLCFNCQMNTQLWWEWDLSLVQKCGFFHGGFPCFLPFGVKSDITGMRRRCIHAQPSLYPFLAVAVSTLGLLSVAISMPSHHCIHA